jgi:5-methylcytosine-specific restriction protein A
MSDTWSNDELRAAIEVYVDMRRRHREDRSYMKSDYYDRLTSSHDRSRGAFEYRMRNISYVLAEQGRWWLPGLRPAQNVGRHVADRIEEILADVENRKTDTSVGFRADVDKAKSQLGIEAPVGNKKPESIDSEVTRYKRDPEVVAWVEEQADGECECCDSPAPFENERGSPYLEVHHVLRLADGGPDTVANAVAVCPNCHRELHYGSRKSELAKALVEKIDRLLLFQRSV